ncbi:CLUMA_CG009735, isoform A [Clunio marinus]|uniref:CLUMA_CG009735, isoform A n=1 Tax=Clunio marinus TaxID=568069 RepID=A0A1J1I9R5_9DIPT|nr:CLUMA_CG009735, isoform A [Clunio marinus]
MCNNEQLNNKRQSFYLQPLVREETTESETKLRSFNHVVGGCKQREEKESQKCGTRKTFLKNLSSCSNAMFACHIVSLMKNMLSIFRRNYGYYNKQQDSSIRESIKEITMFVCINWLRVRQNFDLSLFHLLGDKVMTNNE